MALGPVLTGLKIASLLVRPAFWRKVRANRKAARAGQPKPYDPWDLVEEGLDLGEAAVREGKAARK